MSSFLASAIFAASTKSLFWMANWEDNLSVSLFYEITILVNAPVHFHFYKYKVRNKRLLNISPKFSCFSHFIFFNSQFVSLHSEQSITKHPFLEFVSFVNCSIEEERKNRNLLINAEFTANIKTFEQILQKASMAIFMITWHYTLST